MDVDKLADIRKYYALSVRSRGMPILLIRILEDERCQVKAASLVDGSLELYQVGQF